MATLLIVYLFALSITLLVFLTLYHAVWKYPTHPDFAVLSSQTSKTVLEKIRDRIRILMFGWEFPPFNSGGLGVASLGIVKGLSEHDADIALVLPKKLPNKSRYARLRSANLPERTHAVNSPLSPYLASATYATFSDGTPVYGNDLIGEVHRYGALAGAIAQEEAHDLIYAHDWLSFPAGIHARNVSGKPFIAHVHATEFDRTGGTAIDQRIYDLEREGLHAADKIIAVSERTKNTVVTRYGIRADKVTVVHNGIDEATAPTHSDNARLMRLKKLGYRIVLFIGRITIQKGPDYFLRAAQLVLNTSPRTVFVIAGAGDMERQIIEQAAELGIADKVFFTGFVRDEEQHQAYAAAHLFVMPSVSEPFGITALEAMRAGVPVIISKQSGVAEAVDCVVRVDFWDIEKLARHMISLLSDPNRCEVLAARGKKEVAKLTWHKSGAEIRRVAEHMLASTPN